MHTNSDQTPSSVPRGGGHQQQARAAQATSRRDQRRRLAHLQHDSLLPRCGSTTRVPQSTSTCVTSAAPTTGRSASASESACCRGGSHMEGHYSLDAHGQCLALVVSSVPRCGVKSAACLMSTITGHLFRQLWDDWIMGTEAKFLLTAWQLPEGYDPTMAAALVCKPLRSFSLGISRLTCGITSRVADKACDSWSWPIDWNRSLIMMDNKLIMRDLSGGDANPKDTGLYDFGGGVKNVATSDRWVAFGGVAGVGNSGIQVHFLRIVDISGATPETDVLIPGREALFIRCDFLLGELVGTWAWVRNAPNGTDFIVSFQFEVYGIHTFQRDPSHIAITTRISTPAGRYRVESLARLRKRSGECVFIVGLQFCPSVYQVSDSMFCLSNGFSCEIWDCNNTDKPLKVIPLFTLHQPTLPVNPEYLWNAVALSGFLFHFRGKQLKVIDVATQTAVLKLDMPTSGDCTPKQLLLHVWSPVHLRID
ncbi:hypothetical protein Pelo_3657 [Pelomyxa schiedti]|nr:hypothetical protein Pelo_3657 [Pelomyxa schiedti]